ncbi:MAG: hypothetical protein ACLQGV_11630 [Bryobacteraceae bacterium]
MHTRALLVRRLRIAVAVSMLALLGVVEMAAQSKAASKALTVSQLEALVRKGSPDSFVSQELRSRGLASPVDWPLITRLTNLGAGPKTIAALEHLLPKVRLAIRTSPGAEVFLNETAVATVGEGGELVLAVQPGDYQLRVAQKDRTSFGKAIRLALNQPVVVEAPLEWTVGYLTLDTGVPDALIDIVGVGKYATRVEKLAVPVGPRQIWVTAPFRSAFSSVVAIEGGKTLELPVKLEWDPIQLKALGDEIQRAYSRSEYPTVIALGPFYWQRGGADAEALKDLALSYAKSKQFDAFPAVAARALAAGAEFTFRTKHFHGGVTLHPEHPAELGVNATAIRYTPLGKCNLGPMTVPLAQLRCSLRSAENSSTLILAFPNPKNPIKTLELDLVGEAPAELEAIMRLIEMSNRPAPKP